MSKTAHTTYTVLFAAFLLIEIVTWFYLPDKEYFFLLWTFISLIGAVMVFKREKWWLRFRPFRVSGQYVSIREPQKAPDVDYTMAEEQGMGVDAAKETKEKNPFAVPRKPKAIRLGMLAVLAANIIGLVIMTIYLH